MKQKNLVKKAVFPALVALLCSVIALTSVSYAWFSLGDTAKVQGLDMTVTSASGLQISALGTNGSFKSTINLTDLQGNDNNEFPVKVSPASTDANVTGTNADSKLTFYTAEIVNDKVGDIKEAENPEAEQGVIANGYYMVFDLYINVSANKSLQLENTSTVSAKGDDKGTHYSARVAFINLGYAGKADDAMAGTLTGGGAVKVWEPNAKTRSNAYIDAGGDQTTGKLDYQGISGVNAEDWETVETFDVDQAAETLFALGEGFNRIRVYIWMEGQDVDCINKVSGGIFSIVLDFKQVDTVQP